MIPDHIKSKRVLKRFAHAFQPYQLTYRRLATASKKLFTLLLIAPLVGPLNACAVLFSGTRQDVPFSSSPPGTEVYVNGKFMGVTPLELSLCRNKQHEIRVKFSDIERNFLLAKTMSTAGAVELGLDVVPGGTLVVWGIYECLNPDAYFSCEGLPTLMMVAGAGLIALPVAIDLVTGAYYELSPGEVFVDFEAESVEP